MLKRFITHTYACLPNKGGHNAVKNLQKMMRIMKRNNGKYYILKCDIAGYFYNIDCDILYHILEKKIEDKKLLKFTRKLIYDTNEKKGIPIGNYTSQFFANIYLNELDQYVKQNLRVRFYIRYMDDFILLCKTKEEAKKYYLLIEEFIQEKLALELNHKSKYYPSRLGADFCGYIIYETHCKVRKRSKQKMRKKIKKWNKQYKEGNVNLKEVTQSWNAWLGHIKHANSYNLMKKYKQRITFLDLLEEEIIENPKNNHL